MAVRPGREEEILLEETNKKAPRTRDKTDEEKNFRKVLREQIEDLKAAGIEIVVPAEIELS